MRTFLIILAIAMSVLCFFGAALAFEAKNPVGFLASFGAAIMFINITAAMLENKRR